MLEAWCGPIELYSSNNFSKTCMVHVVLPIVIMWRGVDEPTPKISFLLSKKKKKKKIYIRGLAFRGKVSHT